MKDMTLYFYFLFIKDWLTKHKLKFNAWYFKIFNTV